MVRFREWYETPSEDRKEFGLKGREWMLKDGSRIVPKIWDRFIDHMENLEEVDTRKRFTMYTLRFMKPIMVVGPNL